MNIGTGDETARFAGTNHHRFGQLGGQFAQNRVQFLKYFMGEAVGIVITSYSIHYTKLYEYQFILLNRRRWPSRGTQITIDRLVADDQIADMIFTASSSYNFV